jgi:hypothetical protein
MAVNKHIEARTLVIAAVLAATIVLGIDGRFGPQPWVWNFKYGAVVVHLPWLVALLLISAGATFLSRRGGANLSQRVLVAVIPALMIGTVTNLVAAVVVIVAGIGGQRIHPRDFVGHFLVGWLLIPLGAALLGSLPFLWGPRMKGNGGQITR